MSLKGFLQKMTISNSDNFLPIYDVSVWGVTSYDKKSIFLKSFKKEKFTDNKLWKNVTNSTWALWQISSHSLKQCCLLKGVMARL